MQDPTPTVAPTAPALLHSEAACPNCGAPSPGRFCASCGQRQHGRLSLRILWQDFASRFLSAENGFLPTMWQLATRPGRCARRYLDGQRKALTAPLGIYALGATAQVLGLWSLKDQVKAQITAQLPDAYFQFLAKRGIQDPKEFAGERYLALMQSAYSWLGLFAFVMPMAVVARLLLGRRANLAELLAVALYSAGFVMLVTAVTGQALVRWSPQVHGTASLSLYFVHGVCIFGGGFGWRWRPLLAGAVGTASAMAGMLFSIGVLTGIVLTFGV
ncbi:MAG: DUF3667 domain-containing protein [Planctomycetes bacterium]|jgi:hypothetical protein|nr:DUF3667 domain-containing protein [Planctomycetota bacterium]